MQIPESFLNSLFIQSCVVPPFKKGNLHCPIHVVIPTSQCVKRIRNKNSFPDFLSRKPSWVPHRNWQRIGGSVPNSNTVPFTSSTPVSALRGFQWVTYELCDESPLLEGPPFPLRATALWDVHVDNSPTEYSKRAFLIRNFSKQVSALSSYRGTALQLLENLSYQSSSVHFPDKFLFNQKLPIFN